MKALFFVLFISLIAYSCDSPCIDECSQCGGTGQTDECWECKGSGRVKRLEQYTNGMSGYVIDECSKCEGTGRYEGKQCYWCSMCHYCGGDGCLMVLY